MNKNSAKLSIDLLLILNKGNATYMMLHSLILYKMNLLTHRRGGDRSFNQQGANMDIQI